MEPATAIQDSRDQIAQFSLALQNALSMDHAVRDHVFAELVGSEKIAPLELAPTIALVTVSAETTHVIVIQDLVDLTAAIFSAQILAPTKEHATMVPATARALSEELIVQLRPV
jgi:hypothetical protein